MTPNNWTYENGRQDAEIAAQQKLCAETRDMFASALVRLEVKIDDLSRSVWILQGRAAIWGALGGVIMAAIVSFAASHVFGE